MHFFACISGAVTTKPTPQFPLFLFLNRLGFVNFLPSLLGLTFATFSSVTFNASFLDNFLGSTLRSRGRCCFLFLPLDPCNKGVGHYDYVCTVMLKGFQNRNYCGTIMGSNFKNEIKSNKFQII